MNKFLQLKYLWWMNKKKLEKEKKKVTGILAVVILPYKSMYSELVNINQFLFSLKARH